MRRAAGRPGSDRVPARHGSRCRARPYRPHPRVRAPGPRLRCGRRRARSPCPSLRPDSAKKADVCGSCSKPDTFWGERRDGRGTGRRRSGRDPRRPRQSRQSGRSATAARRSPAGPGRRHHRDRPPGASSFRAQRTDRRRAPGAALPIPVQAQRSARTMPRCRPHPLRTPRARRATELEKRPNARSNSASPRSSVRAATAVAAPGLRATARAAEARRRSARDQRHATHLEVRVQGFEQIDHVAAHDRRIDQQPKTQPGPSVTGPPERRSTSRRTARSAGAESRST